MRSFPLQKNPNAKKLQLKRMHQNAFPPYPVTRQTEIHTAQEKRREKRQPDFLLRIIIIATHLQFVVGKLRSQ